MIPYSRQFVDSLDVKAVEEVLTSDFLTQGPVLPKFETVVKKYCNASFAIAVNSATSALHIACLALDLKPGDTLWTSPNSFVSSANCALFCGAEVDFVDIDPKTYNMCILSLEKKLIEAKKHNRLPKIIIPVHFAGQSCEMDKFSDLKERFGFKIIEDASHAVGGKYKNKSIGCCDYSDITIFSFHPVKIITTGEGGMALTNDKKLAEKMDLLRSHGITKNKNLIHNKNSNQIWNYQQVALGYNYRMTDLQAALGVSQFQKLDKFIKKRHEIANAYYKGLAQSKYILPWQSKDTFSSYHLFPIRVSVEKNKGAQKKLYTKLHEKGIAVNIHYIPIHQQPYFQNLGFKNGDFPNAEKFYSETISLPMYYQLSGQDQDFVIDTLIELERSVF